MNEVNITKYNKKRGHDIVFFGQATVKKGYYFVDGDENFYHFIGKNSVYSMLELLHPDDIKGFLDMLEHLQEGEQCAIVRMKCYNNQYRYLYMTVWLNGRVYDGFASFTFDFCDIMEIKDRYAVYKHLVKKYRGFMSLSSLLFFEYTFEDDELKIYHYVNVKSCPLLTRKLDDIRDEIEESTQISIKSKAEFNIFYEFLKKGTDRFYTQLDAKALIPDEEETIQYQIKGSTMYQKSEKSMVVGIINVCGKKEKKESYYLTEGALDPGTGLFNKRAINEYAVEKIQECEKEKKSFYLAVVDIDDFKKVNDTYGHMFGDEVISKVSEIMKNVLDARGMVGRFGGDEFMIVIENVETEEGLRRILKTIVKHILWEYEASQDKLMITTSWGIAKYPDDGASYEALFEKADKALYIAKAKGKNRVIIYDKKKHSDFKQDGNDSRDSGIRMIASDEKKASAMTELTIELYQKGKEALPHVMEMMSAYFGIDGVVIYQGEEMKRLFSYGKYVNPIDAFPQIMNRQYIDRFDELGIYEESNIQRLSNIFPDMYRLYEQQEIGKFIQCISVDNATVKALVSFDFFNRWPKIGVTDMGMIKLVGRMMAEVVAKCEI